MAGKTGYCTLIVFCLLSYWCNGQTITFNRTYDFNHGVESGLNIFPTTDGYIIIGSGGATELGGWRAIKLIKVDFWGNVIWKKLYGEEGKITTAGWYNGIADLGDGFVLAGTIADSANINGRGVLYRFNADGDTLWTHVYDSPSYELFNSVRLTKDKGYIVAGTRYSPNNNPNYWLLKTDSLGIAEWDTLLGTGYATTVENSLDGGFVIGGSGGNFLSSATIVKTDSVGNIQWSKVHFGGNQYGCYWSVGLASDGGYYIWGCYDTIINSGDFYLTPVLAKLNVNGTRLWANFYNNPNNLISSVYQVKELSDGNIILTGERDDGNPILSVGGWIVKMDNMGGTIWEKIHSYTQDSTVKLGSNSVYDFSTTSDGGLILTGYGFNDIDPGPNFNNNQDIWLLKLDSLGNWYAPADTDTCPPPCDTVGIGEIGTLHATLYPNPATNTLTIELPGGGEGRLTLYNLLGQEVFGTATHGRQTTVRLSLPPGVYIYRITQGTQHANGKLLVE